jgi:ABC-2 type transport system permease protein
VVAHLVRLKLAMLGNGLRRSGWRMLGFLLGALYTVTLIGLAVIGLLMLGHQDDAELTRTVLTLAGTVLVAGWWLVPLVAFGVDGTLDPERFRLFPIARPRLLLALGVAGLVGLPGVSTVVVSAATAVAWWRSPAAVVAALVGAALAVAICMVGSRAITTLLAPLVTGRRFREVAAVLMLVPLVLIGPIALAAGAGLAAVADLLPTVAVWIGWSPLGAPWAMAADVSEGAWLAALGKLAVAALTLLAGIRVWDHALARALVRPEGGAHSARSAGLGFFDRLPATPVGAVAARCLTSWVRDSRYAAAVAVVPLQIILLWFLDGGNQILLAAAPVVAFVMGWVVSSDVAYDGTAFWTHVAAPVDGRVDRWGRAVAGLVVGGIVVVATLLISLAITGLWDRLLPMAAMSVGVLATTVGAASVYSALFAFPTTKPGEIPFSTPQGTSFSVIVSQVAGVLVLLVLLIPIVAPAVVAVITGHPAALLAAVLLGPGAGAALLVAGVRIGARVYDRRAPELLQQMRAFA